MGSIFLDALAGTRLYPLTDRKASGSSHARQVTLLGNCGINLIQLREKDLSSAELFAEASAAIAVARERGMKITVNDRVDIALALHADGVHLGQDDLPVEAARHILGAGCIIGLSTHNLEQARAAAGLPVDYIAIGPIFETLTKQAPNPPVGLPELRRVRKAVGNIPLVAIGGITVERSKEILDEGANAISVIRDLWAPGGEVSDQISRLVRGR